MFRTFVFLILAVSVAFAGPKIGGRVGYFSGDDPRTGGTGNVVFGGQIIFPLVSIVDLEISGAYTSSKTDITLENYLFNYLEEEEGVNLGGDIDSLYNYLENVWGWENPQETAFLEEYTATYHDVDLSATIKLGIPIGASPIKPYIGGGGGVHLIASDADVLIALVNEETGGGAGLDPYDHVHPGIHGVIGASFSPPMVPLSLFAEYKYSQALGDEAGAGGISQVVGGINVGF